MGTTAADPQAARRFALEVVQKLREAGFESLWAGGCVRDQLLGRQPQDYDVATNAKPDEIRRVFRGRKTLAIGASFGVISVLGKLAEGQIEVATFRQDAAYSDGRHPDRVTFSTAEEDAKRRDFTINGLFYDPVAERVIDYVGGEQDLRDRVIRAIGDPFARIEEDKLRMLRAVRFAATFEFTLEPQTLAAVQQQASRITVVSAERIAAELRRMLVHPQRARALELLRESRLLDVILPEAKTLYEAETWRRTLAVLQALDEPVFGVALAALLREVVHLATKPEQAVDAICRRWKLANDEIETVQFCLRHEALIRAASRSPWPRLQPVLIAPGCRDLLTLAEAVAIVVDGSRQEIDFCRERLRLPAEELNPLPLLTGDDLRAAGLSPGPAYKSILQAVRDAQLERTLTSREEALKLAQSMWPQGPSSP